MDPQPQGREPEPVQYRDAECVGTQTTGRHTRSKMKPDVVLRVNRMGYETLTGPSWSTVHELDMLLDPNRYQVL